MTTPHPHILMNNRRRRIQTLASDGGMILQPSGKYIDGSIKCLPAKIRRVQMSGSVCFRVWAHQAAPPDDDLWSCSVTLSRSANPRRARHQPRQPASSDGRKAALVSASAWYLPLSSRLIWAAKAPLYRLDLESARRASGVFEVRGEPARSWFPAGSAQLPVRVQEARSSPELHLYSQNSYSQPRSQATAPSGNRRATPTTA